MTNFEMVGDFMTKFDQDVLTTPTMPKKKIQELRVELIREEFEELKEALAKGDMVKIADGLTDILVVTYGAGHAFGLDLDACFAEVMRSNMTKLGADGKPVKRADGKVVKGPNYEKPDLRSVIFPEKTD